MVCLGSLLVGDLLCSVESNLSLFIATCNQSRAYAPNERWSTFVCRNRSSCSPFLDCRDSNGAGASICEILPRGVKGNAGDMLDRWLAIESSNRLLLSQVKYSHHSRMLNDRNVIPIVRKFNCRNGVSVVSLLWNNTMKQFKIKGLEHKFRRMQ